MDEPPRVSEVFEFFEENTPESEELARILDYSDGSGLSGEVAEKYFSDSVLKLKLDFLDGEIDELSKKSTSVTDISILKQYTARIAELVKQKQKLKNGVQ